MLPSIGRSISLALFLAGRVSNAGHSDQHEVGFDFVSRTNLRRSGLLRKCRHAHALPGQLIRMGHDVVAVLLGLFISVHRRTVLGRQLAARREGRLVAQRFLEDGGDV